MVSLAINMAATIYLLCLPYIPSGYKVPFTGKENIPQWSVMIIIGTPSGISIKRSGDQKLVFRYPLV